MPRVTTFEPGSQFGEYTVVRRIGRGGQGCVYEVQDSLGLAWALKVSEEMALHDANAEMRFLREARCVAETLHQLPRNAGVLIGEHYGVWERRFYIKMKLLRGESLAQRLRRVGQLSMYEAVHVCQQVAFAIGQAHELGVLHRDLKPENIFLTDAGEVVVLDWGCLQLLEATHAQARTTRRGVICTPGYAPIEQYIATTAMNLTPAADIYALGVILYESLAGYHPFLNWSRAALGHAPTVPPTAPPAGQNKPPQPNLNLVRRALSNREKLSAGEQLSPRRALSNAATTHLPQASLQPPTVQQPGLDQSKLQPSSSDAQPTFLSSDPIFGAETVHQMVPEQLLQELRGALGDLDDLADMANLALTHTERADSGPTVPHPSIEYQTAGTQVCVPLIRPQQAGTESGQWVVKQSLHLAKGAESGVAASQLVGTAATRTAPRERMVPRDPRLPLGVRPPQGEPPRRFSLVEVLALQQRTSPGSIAGLPPELSRLLSRLLSKRPMDRPQRALELSKQLAQLVADLEQRPDAFADSSAKRNARHLTRALMWLRLKETSHRFAYAGLGALMAAGTGAGVYYGMSRSQAQTQAQTQAAASAHIALTESRSIAAPRAHLHPEGPTLNQVESAVEQRATLSAEGFGQNTAIDSPTLAAAQPTTDTRALNTRTTTPKAAKRRLTQTGKPSHRGTEAPAASARPRSLLPSSGLPGFGVSTNFSQPSLPAPAGGPSNKPSQPGLVRPSPAGTEIWIKEDFPHE